MGMRVDELRVARKGSGGLFAFAIITLLLIFNIIFSTKIPVIDSTPELNSQIPSSRICTYVWGYFYDQSDERFGREYLEGLYHRSVEYHNYGGNYKALSHFMDRAIDGTYDMIGLTPFTLDDGKSKAGPSTKYYNQTGPSTQGFIREELRKRDKDNRGGYYQRKFPGKFQQGNGNRHNELFQNGRSITSVMEPVTAERWDIAMGPRLEQGNCKGFHVLKKKWDQTKYICGWDQLSSSNNQTVTQQEKEFKEK